MIPLSDFLTFVTCLHCVSISMFLWIIPIPPSLAIAIAARCSVTVSIAAETIGILRDILRVSLLSSDTSFGSTSEY